MLLWRTFFFNILFFLTINLNRSTSTPREPLNVYTIHWMALFILLHSQNCVFFFVVALTLALSNCSCSFNENFQNKTTKSLTNECACYVTTTAKIVNNPLLPSHTWKRSNTNLLKQLANVIYCYLYTFWKSTSFIYLQ